MGSMDELATPTVRPGDYHLIAHIAACSNYRNSSSALWHAHAHLIEIISCMGDILAAWSVREVFIAIPVESLIATLSVRQLQAIPCHASLAMGVLQYFTAMHCCQPQGNHVL
jgi:hypothetical protein